MGDLAGDDPAGKRERLAAGSTLVVVASLMPARLAAVVTRLHDEGHHVFVSPRPDRVDSALRSAACRLRDVGRVFQRAEVLR